MDRKFLLSELIQYLESEGLSFEFPERYKDITLLGFSPITNTRPGTLTWIKGNNVDLENIKASVIICSLDFEPPKEFNCFFIRVPNPRLAFTKVLSRFSADPVYPRIEDTAVLNETCEIGDNVYIGDYVVIGENVKIGNGVIIHSHVKLYPNTIIKDNCIIHSGCIIGGDGFGYERNSEQTPLKIPHLGGVIIHENVEIGSNSCVDRGTLSNTIIDKNSKISNLCNVSHNVTIGKNVMICAQACVNGSTKVEDNVWISPGAILNNRLIIGHNSTIGLGAVVIRNVEPYDVVAGVPATSLKKAPS